MKEMTDEQILAKSDKGQHPYGSVGGLRFSARLAHLDGRDAMSREWNRRANRLAILKPNRNF